LAEYRPDIGEIIWLDFLQVIPNEQAGRRAALMLSPRAFNELPADARYSRVTHTAQQL
jgi:mRNA-degrading endonuclease toxin of MazEF toxin-antitoxin module